MSATNRAQLINKLFKVARKHYQPITPVSSRSVLEHMLYACLLENSFDEAADEAFAKLEEQYFDWNEVRVTTASELAESTKRLYDSDASALLIKKALHGIFETYYKFDIDFLKKENLRKTVQQFNQFRGVSPFVVSYTAQIALGGHFIPLDDAMLQLMEVVGIISGDEAKKRKVPGLERTIAKNKGVEFASVVHQLATAFYKSPHNKDLRKVLLSIASDAADRFPKRGGKKKVVEPPKPEPKSKPEPKAAKKVAAKASAKKPAKKAPPAKKKPAAKPAKKKATKKKAAKKAPAKKKAAAKPAKKASKKKKSTKKATKKKSSTRSLSRRKPR